MIAKLTFAAGALALALAAGTHVASAAPASQSVLGTAQAGQSMVQTVQYGSCRRWSRECADRWGWRTRGYFRCMARRGC